METVGDKTVTKKWQKVATKYYCEKCHYTCCKKYNWDKHITTRKHIQVTLGDRFVAKSGNEPANHYCCVNCNKEYISRNGLWKHNKICKIENNMISNDNEVTEKELMMMIIKDNSELKNIIMDVVKNGTHHTTNTHTNSHNKSFNLNFFLNETCKDAMNIMDFVDSIQLQLSDLEKVGEIGFVDGISNIITAKLKALNVTERPIHCTDKKREVLYVKDEDKWEKDEEKKKIRKVVKKVANKNSRLLQQFKEAHPDCGKSASLFSDQYNKLIIEAMGGSGDNDLEKEDKIIHIISKNVIIDKE